MGQSMSDLALQDFAWIKERIARVPRVPIAIRNTPLQEAPNLTKVLAGPRIFVKRDDLTGVAFGGNKLRNLEFRLARTASENPDTVIVTKVPAVPELGLTLVMIGVTVTVNAGPVAMMLPARTIAFPVNDPAPTCA